MDVNESKPQPDQTQEEDESEFISHLAKAFEATNELVTADELVIEHLINKKNVVRLLQTYLRNKKPPPPVEIEPHESDSNEMSVTEAKSMLITSSASIEITDAYASNQFDRQVLITETRETFDEQHLPDTLIVTTMPNEVFTEAECKSKFESLFLDIDDKCKFCFIRIFNRCSISFSSSIAAILARIQLDEQLFLGQRLKIFLTKVK